MKAWPAPVVAAAIAWAPAATAQVHWDASAEVGVMKRWLDDRRADTYPGQPDPSVGPTIQAKAHVALLPLLRVGAYLGHDLSPLGAGLFGWNTRQITWGGLRAKGMVPFVTGPARLWIFAGIGYAAAYQRNLDEPPHAQTISTDLRWRVQGAGGAFFEAPFGIGASYKLTPLLALTAEVGARVGFGHSGDLYETGPRLIIVQGVAPTRTQPLPPAPLDRFAIGATVGVMLDR